MPPNVASVVDLISIMSPLFLAAGFRATGWFGPTTRPLPASLHAIGCAVHRCRHFGHRSQLLTIANVFTEFVHHKKPHHVRWVRPRLPRVAAGPDRRRLGRDWFQAAATIVGRVINHYHKDSIDACSTERIGPNPLQLLTLLW